MHHRCTKLAIPLLLSLVFVPASAFQTTFVRRYSDGSFKPKLGRMIENHLPASCTTVFRPYEESKTVSPVSSSALRMYNLPPENKDNNPISDLLPGILTLVGLTAFFMSPLGGIFFAITNSLFLISFLTPVVLFVGFQLWKSFNTIDADCPSCQSPVTVLKNGEPTICLGCGSVIRSTMDQKGVEICNAAPSFEDNSDFFGGNNPFGGSIFDSLSTPSTSISTKNDQASKSKRDNTIIDIDFTED